MIEVEEFIAAYQKKDPNLAEEHLRRLFKEADTDDDGKLQFDEFLKGGSLNICNACSVSIELRHILTPALSPLFSVTNAKPHGRAHCQKS